MATNFRIWLFAAVTIGACGGSYWLWINRYAIVDQAARTSEETNIAQADGYYLVTGPGDLQAVFRRGFQAPVVGPRVYEVTVFDGVLLVAQRPLNVEFLNEPNRKLGDCRIVAIDISTGEHVERTGMTGKLSCD